jgi:NitT/TauT family transport system ATP-binding protein
MGVSQREGAVGDPLAQMTPAGGVSDGREALLEAKGLVKRFRKGAELITAVEGLDLRINRGEFVCIIGPSGCGKSTLLNMTAGLMTPSEGQIRYRGQAVPEPNTQVGYITQRDNLMPWRTVEGNIGLGLEIERVSRRERGERLKEMIDLVGLTGFEEAYPTQLSGGMRKRASLARTLVCDPETILADEPFGALDAQLKMLMQGELLRIWNKADDRTVIFITHDLAEAITLADRVVVLTRRPGRVKVDCPVNIPRPRDVMKIRFTERFGELHEQLWEALGEELAGGEDAP